MINLFQAATNISFALCIFWVELALSERRENSSLGKFDGDRTTYHLYRLPTISDENCNGQCTIHERCCMDHGKPRCCPKTSQLDENSGRAHKRRGMFSSYRYPSFWNMWYFWFAMIMIMATCFTGCNYWRKQRQLQLRHMFRQYGVPQSGPWEGTRSVSVVATAHPSGQHQIIIPVTLYEDSPDLFRVPHNTRRNPAQHNTDFAPPSYAEVTNKPEVFPPPYSESAAQTFDSNSEPPSYDDATGRTRSSGRQISETHERSHTAAVSQEANSRAAVERMSTS